MTRGGEKRQRRRESKRRSGQRGDGSTRSLLVTTTSRICLFRLRGWWVVNQTHNIVKVLSRNENRTTQSMLQLSDGFKPINAGCLCFIPSPGAQPFWPTSFTHWTNSLHTSSPAGLSPKHDVHVQKRETGLSCIRKYCMYCRESKASKARV